MVRLHAAGDHEVTLKEGRGGVFEITCDGRSVYSKKASGRFPSDAEIDALVGK
jgi:selT/selW/selH-like putative selenoprotein